MISLRGREITDSRDGDRAARWIIRKVPVVADACGLPAIPAFLNLLYDLTFP